MAESAGKAWLYAQSDKLAYGIKKYIIDDESGVSELPKDARIGSSCLVIASGAIYVINSKHEWVKLGAGNSDSGSSDEPAQDENSIYDGGEVE